MKNLIKPKDIVIQDIDKNDKHFRISRLPALLGRKIAKQYVLSLAPKVGNYELNESFCRELMSYSLAIVNGVEIPLETDELINQHTGDQETLIKLENEILAYNTSFLASGETLSLSNILKDVMAAFDFAISTNSPEQSSNTTKQLCGN